MSVLTLSLRQILKLTYFINFIFKKYGKYRAHKTNHWTSS
jgi:hypothetical protein